jgi:hypothetical protein
MSVWGCTAVVREVRCIFGGGGGGIGGETGQMLAPGVPLHLMRKENGEEKEVGSGLGWKGLTPPPSLKLGYGVGVAFPRGGGYA